MPPPSAETMAIFNEGTRQGTTRLLYNDAVTLGSEGSNKHANKVLVLPLRVRMVSWSPAPPKLFYKYLFENETESP